MRRLLKFAGSAVLLATTISFQAHAATITGSAVLPTTAVIAPASPQAVVKYSFQIKFSSSEKTGCGAKLDFSDGRPSEMLNVAPQAAGITHDVSYGNPGVYRVTLSGSANGGLAACLGTTTAVATVTKPAQVDTDHPTLSLGNPVSTTPAPAPNTGGTGGGSLSMAAAGGAAAPGMISATMDAGVVPYGVRQGFKVTGDTQGKMCRFNVAVTADQQVYNQQFTASLPWSSPDLKLPGLPNEKTYTVAVTALAATNGYNNPCRGSDTVSYRVIQEMGSLTAIMTAAKIVAVNQKVAFEIAGKSFGYCEYAVGVWQSFGPQVTRTIAKTVPYQYSTTISEPGQYYAMADQMDSAGAPSGCTGHVKSDFLTVIPRPACPAAQYAYQTPDDNDYGCVVPTTIQTTVTEAFSCPTGYNKLSNTYPEIQYGCHRATAPAITINLTNIGKFQIHSSTTVAALGGGLTGLRPDIPSITKVQLVAHTGGAPRPNKDILYQVEDLRLNVVGSAPNKAGFNPNICGYTVELENLSSHEKRSSDFDTFDVHSVGKALAPGEYSVKVRPHAHDKVPACGGAADLAKFTIYPLAAWITDVKLKGYAFHFPAGGDGGMPGFCENCLSVFSPAHNSAFLVTAPVIASGPQCAFEIVQNDRRTIAVTVNGKAIPSGKDDAPPFQTKWDDDWNTVKVTIKGAEGRVAPACNGSVTKTISWSDKPSDAPVTR